MTMDRSLKAGGGLARTRSVLTRAERIAKMMEEGKFEPGKNCPMGLSKTKVRHSKAGTKSKKAEEAVPAAAAPGAEGAAAPAAGKAAAPAKEEKKK